ncbi:sensor domain-containing diguanylate cyclase [Pseudocolwellia sp. HL-MZ19]|uniref:sensor domain-containing diguanylate cyclase n=1 Tax=Pseudocolwellia sp. HL-MZ19 TaxID=3400846 RepID=UPI003CFBC1C5
MALKCLGILDTPAQEHFDRITQMAKRLFDVPISSISLIDEDRQWFKSKVGLEASETPRDISFCGHTILNDETFIIEDASKDERFVANPLVAGEPFIKFYAGHPLKTRDGYSLGTLCILDLKPRTLSNEDILTLKDLTSIVEDELNALKMAASDELTKISNRRGFIELAKHAIAMSVRQNNQCYIAYFDLDNFKVINDTYGHAAGDNVLVYFANQMQQTFRDSDFYARIGGDEFAVFLSNTSEELAKDAITRLKLNIKNNLNKDKFPHPISFSKGLIKYDQAIHNNIDSFINEADLAMFANKRKNKKSP